GGAVTVVDQRNAAYSAKFYMAGSVPAIKNNNTNTGDNTLRIEKGGTHVAIFDGNGHFLPGTDSQYNIGSSSVRFANIYADTFIGDGDFVELDVDGHTNLDNVNIAGVVTATTFKGALEATSASFSSNIDANGDLDVDGHTNLDNVSISGVSTATGGSVFGNIQAGVGALNATIQKTDNGTLHLQYNKPGNLELCQGGGQV
ncbi:MAG: hypothetical protein VXY93_19010, partial [Pseudomonadota bacterium]|nr:hypothetical protein [Pseudomonadota bacterium]